MLCLSVNSLIICTTQCEKCEHLTRRVLLWVFVWIASPVCFANLLLFLFCSLYFFNGYPALEMALCTVFTWQWALVTDVCTQVTLRLVIFVYTPQAIKRVRIYASFGTYVWLPQQPVHRRFTMMYECVQRTQCVVVSYTTSPCSIFSPLVLMFMTVNERREYKWSRYPTFWARPWAGAAYRVEGGSKLYCQVLRCIFQ